MAYEETAITPTPTVVQFDEDGLSLATNHEGWDVQHLTDAGWVAVNDEPIPSKRDARVLLVRCQTCWPQREHRVYEAVRRLAA